MTAPFRPGSHYAFPQALAAANSEHITRKLYDLPYAALSPAQKLDIYWPAAGNGPFPVILALHGGAFMGGDKRDCQLNPMLAMLEHDYAVVAVNYRLSGEAPFPALVQDVKAAIRWVRANGQRFLLEPDKIAAWGGSAGGYLSLMAGVSAGIAPPVNLAAPENRAALDDLALGNPEQPSHVQAVVDWFGPTDFLSMDRLLAESGLAPSDDYSHCGDNSPESLVLGQPITQAPHLVQAANPESYIRPGLPPFLIQHGLRDEIVPYQHSVSMAGKLGAQLGAENVHLDLLPDARHADPAFESTQNLEKVLAFLDSIFYSHRARHA